jgi:NAD+ kinase
MSVAASPTVFGINEIVLTRERLEAAKLRVSLNGTKQPVDVIGDGLLIATPIGSTGYNRSAGGSVLPIDSSLLALTGLAIHHACDWTNAVVSESTLIEITVTDSDYRPVRLETNMQELTDVRYVRVSCAVQPVLTLLLEPRERIEARNRLASLPPPLRRLTQSCDQKTFIRNDDGDLR